MTQTRLDISSFNPPQAVVVSLRFSTAAARMIGVETHVCELQLVPAVSDSSSESGNMVVSPEVRSPMHIIPA